MDPGVAVGDEREVHDLEEAVHEDLGEVVHHEARRVGAQRLVVQRHGHLPGPLLAGRRGGGGEQEDSGDGEAGGHSVGGSVGMPRSPRGMMAVVREGGCRGVATWAARRYYQTGAPRGPRGCLKSSDRGTDRPTERLL